MSDSERSLSNPDSEAEITLGLLDAVDTNSSVSQRSLARDLGIALGLTNAYLKRCIRKGWIKVSQAPANRYAYYITPKGLAEKGRLTTRYLANSLQFYRQARNEIDDIFAECRRQHWRHVALAGVSELAEIAMLCAMQHDAKVVCVVHEKSALKSFRSSPVCRSYDELPPVDVIIVTALNHRQSVFNAACTALSRDRVMAPALLKINLSAETQGELGSVAMVLCLHATSARALGSKHPLGARI